MEDTMDTTTEENDRHGYSQPTRAQFDAVRAVLGYREAELLALKGPCSNKACSLHRAHSGPCACGSPAPVAELSPDSGTGQPSEEGRAEDDDPRIEEMTADQPTNSRIDNDVQRMADIALAGYERGEVSLTVLAQMCDIPAEDMQTQATDVGYWVAWMTPLLTEASGAAHGYLNPESLKAVLRSVPEPFLRRAGLHWALAQDVRESAAASSVPGLSVCVAQLAVIRQLANAARWMTLPDNSGDLYPAVYVSELLAVLDGVPGTTQPFKSEAETLNGSAADSSARESVGTAQPHTERT